MLRITRRRLAGFALSLLPPEFLRAGIKTLSRDPLITAQDFAQYPEALTPSGDFYVRNHFAEPAIETDRWRLRIQGAVERPQVLSLNDLTCRKQVEITAVLECAGNGNGMGGVGCAAWRGIRLSEIVEECNPGPAARWLRFNGLDRGSEPDSDGVISFSRTIPLEDALHSSTLLALAMNGAPLLPQHGFPCRALVTGNYGMDSVKWLDSIELRDRPDGSLYMARRFRRVTADTPGAPIASIRVKSEIVQPVQGAALRGTSSRGWWVRLDRTGTDLPRRGPNRLRSVGTGKAPPLIP